MRSLSQINALSISVFSSSVVSRYKYLIRSVWVNVFIIGSVFCHLLAEVDQRITHPSQRSINTYTSAGRNFLKTHIKIMPHDEHLFLLNRQFLDAISQLAPRFAKHLFGLL